MNSVVGPVWERLILKGWELFGKEGGASSVTAGGIVPKVVSMQVMRQKFDSEWGSVPVAPTPLVRGEDALVFG